ncbi:hypothetical protein AB205_0093460 [Aquarana catesbeiana]|uniref:Uncharacterized protein n=1 Tax=Aquarana catesbeiana TaxID=8400 RepID=A0A2G9RG13_AQUCT|nr:hypothetical protein AB205_0093460 [Aquarana catesbeiana]
MLPLLCLTGLQKHMMLMRRENPNYRLNVPPVQRRPAVPESSNVAPPAAPFWPVETRDTQGKDYICSYNCAVTSIFTISSTNIFNNIHYGKCKLYICCILL